MVATAFQHQPEKHQPLFGSLLCGMSSDLFAPRLSCMGLIVFCNAVWFKTKKENKENLLGICVCTVGLF